MGGDLREAHYVDAYGRRWAVLLPSELPDEAAPMGLPLGPVPLDTLDLPLAFEVALHNALFDRRIFSWRDIAGQRDGAQRVVDAVRAAVRVGAKEIIDLYREQSSGAPPAR